MSLKKSVINNLVKVQCFNHMYTKHRVTKHLSFFMTAEEIEKANIDPEYKRKVVSEYLSRWPERFRDDVRMADKLLSNAPCFAEAKDKDTIKEELLFYRVGYGFHPEEYVCYELADKNSEERSSYISSKECVRDVFRMNDYRYSHVLNNKGLSYKRFKQYYKRDAVYIQSPDDYAAYSDFIRKHPVFVKKNVFEAMGRSVELIDVNKTEGTDKEVFNKLIQIGPHLLEEKVTQSDVLASLHPSSVNTIRCITFLTRHGIEDPYYFMKIGQAGAFVDNGGAGGILVGIDKETGRLCTNGYDEMNREYTEHPDTKVVFKGYQLPEWEQLKVLCKKISEELSEVKYIGWDMAHTDAGWVVIEGNGAGQMIGPQTVFKRGCKPEVDAFMADMDLIV